MNLTDVYLPEFLKKPYSKYTAFTPIQEKALHAGVLEGTSLLACAPTASGKTFIATLAIARVLGTGKALYVVPLKALASEKFKEYHSLLAETPFKVVLSTGEVDSDSTYLSEYDLIILTTEKLDSLLRHRVPWLSNVKVVIFDEIHLLNDPHRGPVLEVVITLLKLLVQPQIIGLSATIGNPKELAQWLDASLIHDTWRPVELKQGIYCKENVEFY